VEEKKAELLRRSNPRFTSWMANYSMAELRREAHRMAKRPNGMMLAFNGNIVKSDIAIPDNLRESLASAVASLTNIPDHKKDWLPDTNKTMLAVVDPSLYPLVYGVTRAFKSPMADNDRLSSSNDATNIDVNLFCLDTHKAVVVPERSTVDCESCIACCGEGNVVETHFQSDSESSDWYKMSIHNNYQWLPCDIDIRGNLKYDIFSILIESLIKTYSSGLSVTLTICIRKSIDSFMAICRIYLQNSFPSGIPF
jgi:hypothetical protein